MSDHQEHLVIVEDDSEIGRLLKDRLEREGFRVDWVRNSSELDSALEGGWPDLITLDLMLPGEDGLSICRRLRARSSVPILILTAKGDDIDRIIGLELGADDYLPKPFHPRELLARIRAILRRRNPSADFHETPRDRFRFEGMTFDPASRRLMAPDGRDIELTSGDYDLLLAFVQNPLRVLSRDQLMDLTRGRAWEAFDRSIDVAALRLRRKIESDPSQPQIIKTVRNGGYLFAVKVERS